MRGLLLILALALTAASVAAQQVLDPNFKFANASPVFETGKGPVVCIDEAHNNFHTADGRYKSFAEVVRGDGYIVQAFKAKFTMEALAACRVMVIANAVGDENKENWAYPHPSAFAREEIVAVYKWVDGGGALLLIADHSPMAGAAADLGAVLGVAMVDAYAAANPGGELPDRFALDNGGLRKHAITSGRNAKEAVQGIGTFTGHAFKPSWDWEPLLVLLPDAMAVFHLNQSLGNEAPPLRDWPRFSVAGWSQGATRILGKGRIVILGEAAMCSAQLAGPEKRPMGMNHPRAAQNAQFCLNTVRWLSGALPALSN